jgi:hypothetical protein
MKYWFLNICVGKLIKFLPYVFLFGLLIGWWLEFTWWMPPIVLLILTAVLLLINLGYVEISKESNQYKLKIFSFFFQQELFGPFTVERWWNYSSMGGNLNLNYDKSVIETESSDINVFVRLTDAHKRSILFRETIVFGTRFPNESTFIKEKSVYVLDMLMMCRTDKFFEFLTKNVPDLTIK